MSLRKFLNVRKPADLERKVEGEFITLSTEIASVRIPLKSWNITGLDTRV